MTYRYPEFTKVTNECFDITDRETRQVLLSVNESDQEMIMSKLAQKLYDAMIDKVEDIDFGEIPLTKGDITKLSNYDKLVDSIKLVRDILVQYKQDTSPIDTVNMALQNLITRTNKFEMAYKINVELPIIMYDMIALAIISSTSFMILNCVEFIKQPTSDSFDITVDKVAIVKTKDNLLFNNLKRFNTACTKGEVDKVLDYAIKNPANNMLGIVDTYAIMGAIVSAALIFTIIPMLRELIFFFYWTRVRVSDYFELQANLLQMNAYNLERNSTMDKGNRDKIVKRQMSIVNFFKQISNTIGVKLKDSENKANKELIEQTKKLKQDEVLDSKPDSATTTSSIF